MLPLNYIYCQTGWKRKIQLYNAFFDIYFIFNLFHWSNSDLQHYMYFIWGTHGGGTEEAGDTEAEPTEDNDLLGLEWHYSQRKHKWATKEPQREIVRGWD